MPPTTDKLIVFDLDETLIHATKKPLSRLEDARYNDFFVYHRPGLERFLMACTQLCSIAIWSSADDDYVAHIVDRMLPSGVKPLFIWGKSQCWTKQIRTYDEDSGLVIKRYQNIKPLEKIRRMGFDMQHLLIIDDSLYKVKDNPGNYIIIEAFEGNSTDDAFIQLYTQLKNFTLA